MLKPFYICIDVPGATRQSATDVSVMHYSLSVFGQTVLPRVKLNLTYRSAGILILGSREWSEASPLCPYASAQLLEHTQQHCDVRSLQGKKNPRIEDREHTHLYRTTDPIRL